MMTKAELKAHTKIGDTYRWYYSTLHADGKRTYGDRDSGFDYTVTRFNDKSVWFGSVRKSWNTLVDAINKKTYQQVNTWNKGHQ